MYVDRNQAWREATTPERWIRLSVMWFSQEITKRVWQERFVKYVEDCDYGNKDFLGMPVRQTGWRILGKTGAGMPFGDNGNLLKGQPFGWYVGWAQKDNRKIVFARLVRFSERPETAPAMLDARG